jgi:hypothetical protein
VDGWTVRAYQQAYDQDMGPDGYQFEVAEIELTLTYDIAAPGGGLMNQMQGSNLGNDLFDGTLI